MKMNPVVHFEMPYEDKQRVADFYAKTFGWQPTLYGPEMGNYVLVATSESIAGQGPVKPGMINGGFFEKSSDKPAQYPNVVIAVEDIAEAMKKVTESGGQVLGEPVEIPGYGMYVSFLDTEGNRVALMQPFQMM
jgi:predicted enzyme related to lactoylglutathione lyase